jgi:membrane-associated phospholipid phosphatase
MSDKKGVGFWAGLVLASVGTLAHADAVQSWKTVSDMTAVSLPVLALGLTYRQNDMEGVGQLALSLGSTVAAAELLKSTVHARRPDGSDNKSFPSGHTAVAFSAVSYIDRRYGEQYGAFVPALYGVAALTGVARVEAKKHNWGDVLAGGAIGYGASRFWTNPVQGGRLSVLPAPGGVAVGWARTF